MLPAAGIFSLNPGPPSRKGSPMQVVRRTKSYTARKATKPMKPPVAAAPAELEPPVTGQGIMRPMAKAVSAVSQEENGTPHGGAGTALTGIAEGAQKNKAAIVMVATTLRSFICCTQTYISKNVSKRHKRHRKCNAIIGNNLRYSR